MRTKLLMGVILAGALAALVLLFIDFGQRPPHTGERNAGAAENTPSAAPEPGPGTPEPDPAPAHADEDDADGAHAHVHGAEQPPLPGGDIPSPDAILEASNRERAERVLAPRWRTGDQWTVDTYVARIQHPEGGWSARPRRYRYTVTDETRFGDHEVFAVEVVMLSAEGDTPVADFPPETFYVERFSYALVGLERTSRESGKDVKRIERFSPDLPEGVGSSAMFTSVPFDLPPRGIVGELAAYDDAFTALKFSEPDAPRIPEGELVGAGGDIIEVHFSGSDGTPVHQRWSATDPRWPVESVTPTTRSYWRR